MKNISFCLNQNKLQIFWHITILLTAMSFGSTLFAKQDGTTKPSKAEVIQRTQRLQMPFIANEGQTDKRVKYYASTFGGSIFVTKDGEIVYSLPYSKDGKKDTLITCENLLQNHLCNTGHIIRDAQCRFNILHQTSSIPYQNCTCCLITNPDANSANHHRKAIALKESFVGGKINKIRGLNKAVTEVNYFNGNDSSKWKSNIPTYDVVTLGEVYKGIELKLRAYGNNVEKLFCVKPNAKPDEIIIKISGAKTLKVNKEGQLEAETDLGTVKFTRPIAYQEIDGKRIAVNADYQILHSGIRGQNSESENVYGFKVASYDKTKELVIDPLLASTFLGGSGHDNANSITIDSGGNIYVTGSTISSDFPTTSGSYDTFYNASRDAFVSKFNKDLTNLLASTYLGGSRYDEGDSIVLDSDGNVYVAGLTQSVNFPANFSAYDNTFNGESDVFVSKFNGDLTNLLASTFLGGTSGDNTYSIALDSGKNVYVTGWTYSPDFPTTPGVYDTSYNGNIGDTSDRDTFISKLNENLTSLLASTYLGGSSYDSGSSPNKNSMVLDSDGNVYVTGGTGSSDFPTTTGAYDNSFNGDSDVFVSKLNGNLTNLLASTYLGGSFSTSGFSGYDEGFSIALDSDGNVCVTGYTNSLDFPTTTGAYDTFYNDAKGAIDGFISKLNGDLKNLLASTYLGGSYTEVAKSLSIDSNGNIYVTGWTDSSDFPTTTGAYDNSYNGAGDNGLGDAFVSKLNGDLTNLLASTFLGGSDGDDANSIAIDPDRNVYVTGITYSSDFPTTMGAYDNSFNGGDVFVSKFDIVIPIGSITINNDATYTNSITVTINLSATDNVGITGYYVSSNSTKPALSDSGWKSVASTTNYTGTASYTLNSGDGIKTLYVWYKDNSGNISDSASDDIVLDATDPIVTITIPTTNSSYTTTNSTIDLGGSASDSTSGVSAVTWNNDKGGSGIASGITGWLISNISLASGDNLITVTASDNAGNTGEDTITVNFNSGGIPTPTPTPEPTVTQTVTPTPSSTPFIKGSIFGDIIDTKGNPIESAKIKLKGINTKILKKTTSDEEGLFEFTDLDADTYKIIATKKGYKKRKQIIFLETGGEKEIEIVMKKNK